MSGLTTNTPVSILPTNQQSAGSAKVQASNLTGNAPKVQDATAQNLFGQAGSAILSLQQQIDTIMKALRSNLPQPETYLILDPTGNPVAWLGYAVVDNVVYQGGWFKQLYIGGADAAHAIISTDSSGDVTITNATIILTSSAGTITLDPTVPVIKSFATTTNWQTRIVDGQIVVEDLTSGTQPSVTVIPSEIDIHGPSGSVVVVIQEAGGDGRLVVSNASASNNIVLDGFGGTVTAPNINATTEFLSNGTPGLGLQVVTLAKLSTLGLNGSITIRGGIVTAYTAPT